jgi:hypothetical protein
MQIEGSFYDDEIELERILTLLRSGKLVGEVTITRQENRVRYHLQGEIDESVVLEQLLRATPKAKRKPGRPQTKLPMPPKKDPGRERKDPFERFEGDTELKEGL